MPLEDLDPEIVNEIGDGLNIPPKYLIIGSVVIILVGSLISKSIREETVRDYYQINRSEAINTYGDISQLIPEDAKPHLRIKDYSEKEILKFQRNFEDNSREKVDEILAEFEKNQKEVDTSYCTIDHETNQSGLKVEALTTAKDSLSKSPQFSSKKQLDLHDVTTENKLQTIDVKRRLYKIPDTINTSFGKVKVTFSNTSDGASSNNPVKITLIQSLKFALERANQDLRRADVDPITSINISSTTNGFHSDNSLHYFAKAIDINKINGVRIKNYSLSEMCHPVLLGDLIFTDHIQISKEDLDLLPSELINLSQWVIVLQVAFSEDSITRENIGPKIKIRKPRNRNGKTKYVIHSATDTHHNHIHFAIFNNSGIAAIQ